MLDSADDVILAVDDDILVLRTMARILDLAGYRTQTCHGGEGAMAAIGQISPAVVLLDLHMPTVDGWQILTLLAELDHPPRVIVCSSSSDRDEARKHAFVADVLKKPMGAPELLAAVESALLSTGGNRVLQPDC